MKKQKRKLELFVGLHRNSKDGCCGITLYIYASNARGVVPRPLCIRVARRKALAMRNAVQTAMEAQGWDVEVRTHQRGAKMALNLN